MPMLERFFKSRCLQAALALLTIAFPLRAQNLGSQAPLVLFINGPGRVVPFHDGELLNVGLDYSMVAIPQHGYVFAGWNQVNVITFSIVATDASGNVTNVTSTELSPVPISVTRPALRFTAQPTNVLEDVPGFIEITQVQAWQANFVPR